MAPGDDMDKILVQYPIPTFGKLLEILKRAPPDDTLARRWLALHADALHEAGQVTAEQVLHLVCAVVQTRADIDDDTLKALLGFQELLTIEDRVVIEEGPHRLHPCDVNTLF